MSWSDYQQKSQKRMPTHLVRYAEKYKTLLEETIGDNVKVQQPVAIDLGCGSGVDSIFLAQQGYSVYAIDQNTSVIENLVNILLNKGILSKEQANNIHIIKSDFDKIVNGEIILPKADVVYANFSLPFYNPQNAQGFNNLMSNIKNSVNEGGVIATTMLGRNDSWQQCSLVDEQKITEIYSGFVPIQNNEKEVDAPTQSGDVKHWDVIETVFRKPFESEQLETLATTVSASEPIRLLAEENMRMNYHTTQTSIIADQTFAQMANSEMLDSNE